MKQKTPPVTRAKRKQIDDEVTELPNKKQQKNSTKGRKKKAL
jgi:hypothetical protein